jgi:hypothetical protein
MRVFKINRIVFDEVKRFEDLPKINKSECDDFLSQIIFQKIDQFAFMMSGSLHNAIFDKRNTLPFLILCLEDEISNYDVSKVTLTFEDLCNTMNNSNRLLTPPNNEFKKVTTMKTYPKKANINGVFLKLHFNPYMIALFISDIYFRLYNYDIIQEWCSKEYIKFESIEKITQIIDDKYSYRFGDLTEISCEILTRVYKASGEEVVDLFEAFLGFKGTDLTKHYLKWADDFYYNDLLVTIKGLFGKLKYS